MKKIAEIRILDLIKQTKTYKFIWVSVIFHCQQQLQKSSINASSTSLSVPSSSSPCFLLQTTQSRKTREKVGGVEKFPKKSACDSNKKKSASTTARRNKPPRSITRALLILAEEEKVKRAMSHRPNPASYVDNNNNNNNSNNKQNTNNNSNGSNCVDEHRRWDYYNNGQ